MKNIYIIKTGSTFNTTQALYKDFEDWIIDKLDTKDLNISIVDIQKNDALPNSKDCDGIVITGSHSMVSEEESWSLNIEKWLMDIVQNQIPTLAICYGHQLLAKALGGVSDYHPKGIEIGTVDISLNDEAKKDELFCDMPSIFKAHTIHSQSALSLPKDSIILASNQHDPHHAFRIGKHIWGVQFHPEFDKDIMDSYIKEVGKEKGFTKEKIQMLLENTKDTNEASNLLKRFGNIVVKS